MQRYFLWIGIICLWLPNTLTAQADIKEEALTLESILIDAGRERLLGNKEKAAGLYQKALELSPTCAAAAFELARLSMAKEDFTAAQRFAEQAAANDQANTWYARLLGDVYQAIGKNREAAAVYEKLSREHPDQLEYFYKWAFFLVKADNIPGALKVYDDLERRIGINEEIIRRKHALYLGMGDNKKAARELERLAAAFPRKTEYGHILAEFYLQIGDKAMAEATYRKILAADPNDTKATMALAGKEVRPSDDLQYIASLKERFSNRDIPINTKIGAILPLVTKLSENNDPQLGQALLELTGILEQVHPREAAAFAAGGDVLYYSGKSAEAGAKYRQSLQLDDTVYPVWEQLLTILYEQGNCPELSKVVENAIDIFPNKAYLHYQSAMAAYLMGNLPQAKNTLEQALLMTGNDQGMKQLVLSATGLVQTALDNFPAADQAFAEALKIQPNNPVVLARQALSLASRPQGATAALDLARKARQTAPREQEATHALGWALYKNNQAEEARTTLNQLLPSANPLLLEHLGDVTFRSGNPAEALNLWNQAREKGNRYPRLTKKIADKQLYE